VPRPNQPVASGGECRCGREALRPRRKGRRDSTPALAFTKDRGRVAMEEL
jgi:hypothetical protein